MKRKNINFKIVSRKIFKLTSVFLGAFLLFLEQVFCVDYTRFLKDHFATFISPAKENVYKGEDMYRIPFMLKIHSKPRSAYIEVTSSIFIEAIGLPHVSIYPRLFQESQSLQTKDKLGSVIYDGDTRYLPATLQQEIDFKLYEEYKYDNFKLQGIADFLGHLMAHFVLGLPVVNEKESAKNVNIVSKGSRFLTKDLREAFFLYNRRDSLTTSKIFESHRQLFPFELSRLNKSQREALVFRLNTYLSRIEILQQEGGLRFIFFKFLENYKKYKVKKDPFMYENYDFYEEMKLRIALLRRVLLIF